MKANELRIGNLITIDNRKYRPDETGKIFYVVGFTFDNIRVSDGFDDFGQLNEFIKPIPLTEDWLLKFGFEKTERRFMQIDQNVFAIHSFSIPIQNGRFMYDYIGGNIELKYVHQLQNLYFASTGEELLIKD